MKTFLLIFFTSTFLLSFSQNQEKQDTSLINLIIEFGKTYKGTTYKYGSCSSINNGFDCSGFMNYIFRMAGKKLPRSSYEISQNGKTKDLIHLKKGDLVFFDTLNKGHATHVGIVSYIDKEKVIMLHVSSSKGVQEIDIISSSYWFSNFLFGKRIFL